MSLKATSWALNMVRCKPDLKAILVSMADHADDNGICWPGMSLIAEKSGVSTKTVKRKIAKLVEFGVITKFSRCAGYNKTTNKYRLHLESEFDLVKLAKESAAQKKASRDKLSPLEPEPVGTNSPHCLASVGTTVSPPVGTELCPPNRQRTVNLDNVNIYTTEFSELDPESRVTISPRWKPSKTAYDILQFTDGFSEEFISSCLPGFIFYWLSRIDRRRQSQAEFDSRFVKHVRVNHRIAKSEAQPIPDDWSPSREVCVLLARDGVPGDFIELEAQKFHVYWRDRGTPRHSWATVFMDWCFKQFEQPARDGDAFAT